MFRIELKYIAQVSLAYWYSVGMTILRSRVRFPVVALSFLFDSKHLYEAMIYWVYSCDYSLLETPWSKLLALLDFTHIPNLKTNLWFWSSHGTKYISFYRLQTLSFEYRCSLLWHVLHAKSLSECPGRWNNPPPSAGNMNIEGYKLSVLKLLKQSEWFGRLSRNWWT